MKLCVTLAAPSVRQLDREIRRHAGHVDLIEVRLDSLAEPSLPELPDSSTAFIATCRPHREGGEFRGEERERLGRLAAAARHGFDWVDLEYDAPAGPELSEQRLIRSRHLFGDEAGRDFATLAAPVEEAPGAVSKLAVQIDDTAALTRLLEWMERESPRPRVWIGMGEYGRLSRLLGGFLHNAWSYVTPDQPVAPGQFTLAEARDLYGLERCHEAPSLYGLLGNPVGHSLSPRLHNGLFRHYRVAALYLPCALTDVEPWARYVERSPLPFEGFSVTLPFKNRLEPFMGPAARHRSFNTLCRGPEGWRGEDTDGPAFLAPLERLGLSRGSSAVVVGTGGVAATVSAALRSRGVSVTIAGRREEAARDLAARIGCGWAALEKAPPADLCVNATPVGQAPEVQDTPLAAGQLRYEVVYDLIYNPVRTRLLDLARSSGARTLSGMEMFIEQAARQFELWTGIDPERELMRELVDV